MFVLVPIPISSLSGILDIWPGLFDAHIPFNLSQLIENVLPLTISQSSDH
jgi:hypothetical protein